MLIDHIDAKISFQSKSAIAERFRVRFWLSMHLLSEVFVQMFGKNVYGYIDHLHWSRLTETQEPLSVVETALRRIKTSVRNKPHLLEGIFLW